MVRVLTGGAATAVVLGLSMGLTACGGGTKAPAPGSTHLGGVLTSWSRACGGILDAETVRGLRDSLPGRVYEVTHPGKEFTHAAEELTGRGDPGGTAIACYVQDEDGSRVLEVDFNSTAGPLPKGTRTDAAQLSSRYYPSENTRFACLRAESAESAAAATSAEPAESVTAADSGSDLDVGGSVSAFRGFDQRSRVAMLTAAGTRLMSALHCTNKVSFPDPPRFVRR